MQLRHGPHRGALQPLRQSSRATSSRTAAADASAVLHQWGGDEFHAGMTSASPPPGLLLRQAHADRAMCLRWGCRSAANFGGNHGPADDPVANRSFRHLPRYGPRRAIVAGARRRSVLSGPHQGEKFPLKSTDIIFDSFTLPDPAGHAKFVNCVLVLKPSYPYHIDWVGSGIDAFTGKDGSQSSSLYVGDHTQMDPSTAFVGINRTPFDPHLIHDKPWWVKFGDRIFSTFDGAVSTIPHDAPKKEKLERLQPVAFRFVAQLTQPGRAS